MSNHGEEKRLFLPKNKRNIFTLFGKAINISTEVHL